MDSSSEKLKAMALNGEIFSFKPYLDKGHVALLKVLGDDEFIETAARQSYGDGTRSVNERDKLIRYLLRHDHTSPFEMAEFVFSLKIPIFVARQLVRHRTASLNELSARYSIISDEMYMIEKDRCNPQSSNNKQGSEDTELQNSEEILEVIGDLHNTSYNTYEWLLEQGLSRELSRGVLPTNIYTEMVWKLDFKNMMHFLKLRLDPHAQNEIRQLANLIYTSIWQTGKFDISLNAFHDYILNAKKFSSEELDIINRIILSMPDMKDKILEIVKTSKLDSREQKEFVDKLNSITM